MEKRGKKLREREEHKINKGKHKLSRDRRKRIENKELMRVRRR